MESITLRSPTQVRTTIGPIHAGRTCKEFSFASATSVMADRFPSRPYCTDDFENGIYIRPRAEALQCANLQVNGPSMLCSMVFDIDKRGGADMWEKRGLPAPTWSCTNPANGHAHVAYALRSPVCKTFAGREHPLEYAAAVQESMRRSLSADAAYSGLLTKNPFHPGWITEINPRAVYDIGELVEYLPAGRLPSARKAKATSEDCFGLGRNDSLHKELASYAYRAIRKYWHADSDAWLAHVEYRAQEINSRFPVPLHFSEVRHVAKSVARWVWRHFTKESFSARQAGIRHAKGEKTRSRILAIDGLDSMKTSDIAAACGVSERTVQRIAAEPREKFIAGSVEQQKPWTLEGVSRRTWYRRQQKQ